MNKKFTLHLDAALVLVVLFFSVLGLAIFLQSQVSVLTLENQTLQWQGVEDSFNLSSKDNYILKLEGELKVLKRPE
ncbi:hypothetical protein [Psychromonas hadalis]|uniref:hypothetical protein n=1 Tax=Psychromonas hadalis TaxID=211669 RepID=UPI0003B4AAB0|nr:hypothetical protein [Psychromonas hadalis]